MTRAIEASSCLSEWLAYLRSVREMKEANLAGFIALAETGSLDGCKFTDAYDFSLFHSLSNLILKAYPRLLNFSRTRHERIREEFSSLDQEIQTLYRKRAAHQISRHIVPRGCSTGPIRTYSDLALLNHESQKQRGHISIRSLLNRAGNALMALKPCFMMGPMSVAQYLAPGAFNFDLIVMDEASQLKPEEALGAVARGSQVVIVGDPKQLPPTTFFDSMFSGDISEEEDDNLAIEESESILDRACEVYRPIRQLRWHYRSRHESLIAFSNHNFYDRNLILFPSPLKEHLSLGMKRHFIENGVYSGRVNRPEAERVVNAILNHMEQFPKESLGIATFNSAQRDLIEELMYARTKSDLPAQAYLAEWKDSAEPFFINNLETVQGHERDCMFVSFTYGRDEHGNMYQRFGPINGPTGHRRLNVILTRAKLRTVIFTSMSSEDIKIGDDVSLGVKAMRACLAFSETGILEQPVLGEGQEPNEFEISVKSALSNLGFDVDTQVGVAGYFIDLAIRHPKKSGCYLLGIECDGAPYHSAKSARDRDRLREANLRNLGWDIHRIWSTDWHKNRKSEIERISKYVQQILRKEELPKRN
ncbi:MAG TPA: AAA domain-containing protein [Nitrospira sp.]|nr:AAA domain-containing protein [Nitrospira sp.]